MNEGLMNVTIHDNITSNSVVFLPANKPVIAINELPLPYTGLQMKLKCAEDWYGIFCHQYCFVKNERWRCNEHGNPACAQGYCGWNCLKSGSDCPVFANCSCQNGGECYSPLSESSTKCHCPAGYLGDDCGFFYITESKLDFVTNFGANLSVPNKFSNRADIYQLFEKYEEKLRTSGQQDAQTYQSFGKLAVICALIWLVATTGYCIIKCCWESKEQEQIVETSGDEKKKTSEEEKKCILIEMNDM
ncbi:hypothetical protein GCK72_015477 [Caenorhabditis remanei]|uniref:Delta-like protein n=1 Tax=Caenorhabditis remanei TaxID=31234 RepID=A0A6A5GV27_CAERE|nr:hypothetical protein GCK72_015477 [Caenorhabditis remanei]KAF1759017.1 hypothetical protein GCK72_015477 [Caenorhabditis remanei]